MVWGVELVPMVWVGGGIKKPGGSLGLEICTFHAIIAIRRGQGQRAQRLGEMMGEGENDFFVWGDGVGS